MSINGSDREDGKAEIGAYGELTVGATAVEAKVGGSALAGRTYISVMPKDNSIYYGFDASVTTTTGTRIFKNQLLILPLDAALPLYLIADAAGKKVSVTEMGNDPEGDL